MAERAPQPRNFSEPDPPAAARAKDGSVHELPAQETFPEVGPAVSAFYDFCAVDQVYPRATPEVQDRLRPKLALEFVRQVVGRSAIKQQRPDFKLFFDEYALRRNIEFIQSKYGTRPPADTEQLKRRTDYMNKRMSLASSFINLTEIGVAEQAYTQIIEAADTKGQDSFEILLTAYGMALEERVGRMTD